MGNLYWGLRGTYIERKEQLAKADRNWLEASILDSEYNRFLSKRSSYRDEDKDPYGHGKRLPYIGWFWRHLHFSAGAVPIGDCGEFIGFMANNKWDYPERMTTPEEFTQIMAIIDEAIRLDEQGGCLDKIIENTNEKLDELWTYLQTLDV